MTRPFRWIALAAAATAAAIAALPLFARQDAPPKTQIQPNTETFDALPVPDGAPAEIKTLIADLATEGVRVDFAAKVVEVRGVILLDRMNAGYPIEYLIVTQGGFTHESLGMVRCTPSKLNAAFLALGLTPGKSVRFIKKDPPPPVEKLMSGEAREFDVVAPEGPIVDIGVKWTDDEGEHMHSIEDLIRYVTNDRALPRRAFVYVGSRFTRVVIGKDKTEKYLADVEGNITSLYLSGTGNCLFDMNSAEGVESYLYDVNPAVCPPRGTKVTFVFALR